jgi:hypothetical protein
MKLVSSATVLAFASMTCLGASGCANDAAEPADDSSGALGVSVPNPSGAYFANVTANGTGCPAGTWDSEISADGKQFIVRFHQYKAQLGPGQAFAVSDCTLEIDLRSPRGLSFAVEHFTYDGSALLDRPGMSAAVHAKYYFMGNPLPGRDLHTDLAGAFHDDYSFEEDIRPADLVWSPCNTRRTLEAQTRLLLNNDAAKTGTGSLNATSTDMELRFDVAWRTC